MKLIVITAVSAFWLGTGSAFAATYNLDFTDPTNSVVANSFGDNGQADLSYRAIDANAYGNVVTTGNVFGWTTGYGDLTGAAWGGPNPSHAEIKIEALTPLETVTLNSFEMGGWIADEAAEWNIYDLSWNLLLTGNGIAPDTGAHLSVLPNIGAVGGLIFQWGSDSWDVGVNDVNYSVSSLAAVPLPAGAFLLLGALGGLGFAARRRKVG